MNKPNPQKAAAQTLKNSFLARANGITRGSLVATAWNEELLSTNELKRLGVTATHFKAMAANRAKTGVNDSLAKTVLGALTQKYKLD